MSQARRALYAERMQIPLEGDPTTRFYALHSGVLLATGYTRIALADYGPFVEFRPDQIVRSAFRVPDEHRWRLHSTKVYYQAFQSRDPDPVWMYRQLKPTRRADYRMGMLYISPLQLRTDRQAVLFDNRLYRESPCQDSSAG